MSRTTELTKVINWWLWLFGAASIQITSLFTAAAVVMSVSKSICMGWGERVARLVACSWRPFLCSLKPAVNDVSVRVCEHNGTDRNVQSWGKSHCNILKQIHRSRLVYAQQKIIFTRWLTGLLRTKKTETRLHCVDQLPPERYRKIYNTTFDRSVIIITRIYLRWLRARYKFRHYCYATSLQLILHPL